MTLMTPVASGAAPEPPPDPVLPVIPGAAHATTPSSTATRPSSASPLRPLVNDPRNPFRGEIFAPSSSGSHQHLRDGPTEASRNAIAPLPTSRREPCRLPRSPDMASIHRATPLARRIGRAAAAGVMALGLVAAGMPGSTATPSSRLHTAKGRLTALTNRITSEEAVARQLEDRLTELDVRIADARSRIAGIDAQIMATQRQVTAANA